MTRTRLRVSWPGRPFEPRLKAFRNPRTSATGATRRSGSPTPWSARLDYVVLLHGDGQYRGGAPRLLWPVLHEGVDVVFGSRMLEPRDALRGGMPLYKWLGNRILTAFENLVLNMGLSEFHTGYRLYSTAVLKRIPVRGQQRRLPLRHPDHHPVPCPGGEDPRGADPHLLRRRTATSTG